MTLTWKRKNAIYTQKKKQRKKIIIYKYYSIPNYITY